MNPKLHSLVVLQVEKKTTCERFWGQPWDQVSHVPKQPCWLYAMIAQQQHLPLPRSY